MAIVCVMAKFKFASKLTENAVILCYNFSLSDCQISLIFLEGELSLVSGPSLNLGSIFGYLAIILGVFQVFLSRKDNCSKIANTSCLPKRPRQTGQSLIRLLLKKQSDQGLPWLLFWQESLKINILFVREPKEKSIQNFRTFTVMQLDTISYHF